MDGLLKEFSTAASVPSSPTMQNLSSAPLSSVLSQSSIPWLYTTGAILFALLALEQSVYRYKKQHLPGDNWTIPIIGKFADSMNPTMQGYKKQWDSGVLSAISVFNIFIVMASSTEFSRKILNSPTYAEPCLVHSAKQILMPDNWSVFVYLLVIVAFTFSAFRVFLTGKTHVDYRRQLNTLFTRKALAIYIGIQETICRKHFARWLETAKANPGAQPIMMITRAMNMETSLKVFCGNYLPDHASEEINDKYWAITQALELVNFPLALPGTKVYKAIQARKVAMYWLELAISRSKVAIASGAEPECLVDEWVKIFTHPEHKGRKDFTDREMAMVVFSFLFASQDAMSSGVIYGFQHLSDHPEVLRRVREEQESVRKGDYQKPLTIEQLDNSPYLMAVVKESLRVKPPVTMVPYKTTKAFPITGDYTVPSNSMIIPSFYNALHDPAVFPDPDAFEPERWLDPESTANKNPKNYLVWGSGPHRCIGNEYATMNIALVLSTAAVLFNFEHEITSLSEEVEIIATIFPKDGCRLKFTSRA